MPSAHGWGTAMSTDTAFALGMLALVGPRASRPPAGLHAHGRRRGRPGRPGRDRDRVHASTSRPSALMAAIGFFAAILLVRAADIRYGPVYFVLGAAHVGGVVRVGRRSRDRRPGDGPASPTHTRPRAATSSGPATSSGCSASSPRPSWRGRRSAGLRSAISPNERLQHALPPVDELRDRAAVRAGERRHPRSTRAFLGDALTLADHDRHPRRLRRRQTGRDRRARRGWPRG